jgi:hypothetical protein
VNRRRFTRIDRQAVLSVEKEQGSGRLGQALDLSKEGVRFQCMGLDVAVGDSLRVHMTLAERTVCAVGRVVRATDLDAFTQEIALQLLNLDPEARHLLERELAVPLLDESELEAGVAYLSGLTSGGYEGS